MEMRGPTFSRVFDTPGFGYSERFKHTIGPEVSWTYRTRVEDFNSIPKFDGDDYYLGTNQIAYSLVQRFYAKRRGPTGKALPYEFFNWRLMQTYYVQIADGQSNFDPNYSSSAFGPGFKPEHLSPLMSRMRLKPSPEFSVDFNVEYDVNFKQVRRPSVFGNLNASRVSLNGGWSRAVRLAEDPADRVVRAHTLRGSASLEVFPRRLFLEGSADYDLVNRHPLADAGPGPLRRAVLRLHGRVHPVRLERPQREAVAIQPRARERGLDRQLQRGGRRRGSQGLGGYR